MMRCNNRSSRPDVFCKKVFLEFSQNSQENTCARVSFQIKLQASGNFIKKETLAQVFSCEFCEISKNTFSYRTPPVAASVITVLILLLASCRANQTAMDYCGDGNTCLGSVSSYVCVCEAPGWKLNPSNYKECMEGTISLYCFLESAFSVRKYMSKVSTRELNLRVKCQVLIDIILVLLLLTLDTSSIYLLYTSTFFPRLLIV